MINKILIEGPDCSGKSTLVDRVKNSLRWDSKSLHHLPGNQYQRYLQEYAINNKVVFNRGHISEIVYSKLWRNGNPFSRPEEKILNQIIQANSLIIFCCPDARILKKRYLNRDFEQQIKLDELTQSKTLFQRQLSKYKHFKYYSRDYRELDQLINKIHEIVSNPNRDKL